MSKESKKKDGFPRAWTEREQIEYLELSVHSLNMENEFRKREIEHLKWQISCLSRRPGECSKAA